MNRGDIGPGDRTGALADRRGDARDIKRQHPFLRLERELRIEREQQGWNKGRQQQDQPARRRMGNPELEEQPDKNREHQRRMVPPQPLAP
jgi:hypothetical protein